jgi:UDP-N-acetylmuramoyl-L-alanyl-D-glutamate--2,6-diaminopimelate ligase
MAADPPLQLRSLLAILRDSGLLLETRAPEDLAVTGVGQDSRTLGEGQLFLAWTGSAADAHDFLPQALERGAGAAVVERFSEPSELPQIRVRDGRRAAALLAQAAAGHPGDALRIVAVTGTNGKTTVTGLVRQLLSPREPAAALGTLGVTGPDGRPVPGSGGLTTPGPVELAQRMAGLRDAGVRTLALEASSHALEQRRLDGVPVDVACFTNLTQDHLDYHPTLDDYREAKARLLTLLRDDSSGVVVNGMDRAWQKLPPLRGPLLRVGVGGVELSGPSSGQVHPDLTAHGLTLSAQDSRFTLRQGAEEIAVTTPLLGRFNVENTLVAAGAALMQGIPLSEVARVLGQVQAPAGRMEVTVREPVPVVLDYAHTPDALEKALATLKPLFHGRLILVFGAGGDRDREKRPLMGRVAAKGADLPIVTSDNPRTEDPEAIVDDIIAGMGNTPHLRITDRREAIARALELAREGDVVLLAGKGHETYQVVGTEIRDFDEREVVRELLGLEVAP